MHHSTFCSHGGRRIRRGGPVLLFSLLLLGPIKPAWATAPACLSAIGQATLEPWRELKRTLNGNEGIATSLHGTQIYHPAFSLAHPRIPQIQADTKAIVLMFGGSGSQKSSRLFMLNANVLKKYGIALVALEYPFHGEGPRRRDFHQAENFYRMTGAIIRHLSTSDIPVFLVGHSFGAGVIQEIVFRSPRLVTAAQIFSPGGTMTQALRARYQKISRSGALQSWLQARGVTDFNDDGEAWADDMVDQMKSMNPRITKFTTEIPIEILAGTEDPYGTAPEYAEAAARFPRGRYVALRGVDHHVFSTTEGRERLFDARVVEFVSQVLGQPLVKSDHLENAFATFRYLNANSSIFRGFVATHNRPAALYLGNERAAEDVIRKWKVHLAERTVAEARAAVAYARTPAWQASVGPLLAKNPRSLTQTEIIMLITFITETGERF